MLQTNDVPRVREMINSVSSTLLDTATVIGTYADAPATLLRGDTLVPGLGMDEEADRLRGRAKDLIEGIFNVLVVGTFSNGKSTLLNALVGKEVLIVKNVPSTAIITMLVYGRDEFVEVYEHDSDVPRRMSLEAFTNEYQLTWQDEERLRRHETLERFARIRFARMFRDYRLLQNGIRLIDSPGLEEDETRTRLTLDYSARAHAAICVLDATKILQAAERRFIDQVLGRDRFEHVFFVVNKMGHAVGHLSGERREREIRELDQLVRTRLHHRFADAAGHFNETLYRTRVFYVDALEALNARVAGDPAKADASNIPQFESELEHFLLSDDRTRAAFANTVEHVSDLVTRANTRIADERSAVERPLEELEEGRRAAEERLIDLERRRTDIERTILDGARRVQKKVYASLVAYLDVMEVSWAEDAAQFENLQQIGFWDLLKAAASPERQEEVANLLRTDVTSYFEQKMQTWSTQVTGEISEDLQKLASDIDRAVAEIELQLSAISKMFSASGITVPGEQLGQRRVSRLVQTGLGALMFDPSGMVASTAGGGEWTHFFGRMVEQVVLVIVITAIFSGPFAVFFFALAEWLIAEAALNRFRADLTRKMGEQLFAKLRTEIAARRDQIDTRIDEQFAAAAKQLTTELSREIKQVRRMQDRLIRERKRQTFSVAEQQERLDTLRDILTRLLNDLQVTIAAGVTGARSQPRVAAPLDTPAAP